ncbi:MAG TPA: VIT domain-containing protein [Phycisphaerae bacterium]|nr:VIT domain-containing protein [Phycisphaerae bacterium]
MMKVRAAVLWATVGCAVMGAAGLSACSEMADMPAVSRARMNSSSGAIDARQAQAGGFGVPEGADQNFARAAVGGVQAGDKEELWIVPRDAGQAGQGQAAGSGTDLFKSGADIAGVSGGFGSGGGAGGYGGGRGGAVAGRGGGAGGGARGGGGRGVGRGAAAADQAAIDAAAAIGTGVLAAREQDGELVAVPLKHTDVAASITGYIASVGVTQQFTNPFSEKIEAVYVFPLPENAGVNEFVMTIGDRHIRGIVRERKEAEQIYQQARAQGYRASLMTQERPNIFTQNVANIEPGKEIDISVRYFHTLTYKNGWYEWVFPMVVGPRYNPAGSAGMTNGEMTNDKLGMAGGSPMTNGATPGSGEPGTGIGAVARGDRGLSGQKVEVQYLAPGERSGHDIALKVDVDAGLKIEEMESVNQKIQRRSEGEGREEVMLDPADSIANKDFVLRWRVAGERVKTAMFVQKDENGGGGYFTAMLVPPATLKNLPRRPVEMVFVVDTSGSMSGRPEAQAKAAVDVALQKMAPRDTFQVVKFASGAEQIWPKPVDVSAETVAQARQYVAQLSGNGGTEMLRGINAALAFPHDENRTRIVAFLTDGFIGNELQILKALHEQLERSRVFSFGVGPSTNRYLLDAMARVGHGTAAYLSLNEDPQPVMDAYFEEISHPALSQVQVDFGGTTVTDVYPKELPDLFVGRPVIITGRYSGAAPRSVTVRGVVGNEPVSYEVSAADAGGAAAEHPAIATVWARAKITDLHDQAIYTGQSTTDQVKNVALDYGLISEATAFVAVDSTQVTAGDHGTTVAVPVPVPEGVRYETTVGPGAR